MTELIAREAGVLVSDPSGGRLSAPLDVFTDVAFVAYANEAIRSQVDPALRGALRARGFSPKHDDDADVDARHENGPRSSAFRRALAWAAGRDRVLRFPPSPHVTAPGRLDVMGASPTTPARWCGDADRRRDLGGGAASDEPEVVIESGDIRALGGEATVTIRLAELVPSARSRTRASRRT